MKNAMLFLLNMKFCGVWISAWPKPGPGGASLYLVFIIYEGRGTFRVQSSKSGGSKTQIQTNRTHNDNSQIRVPFNCIFSYPWHGGFRDRGDGRWARSRASHGRSWRTRAPWLLILSCADLVKLRIVLICWCTLSWWRRSNMCSASGSMVCESVGSFNLRFMRVSWVHFIEQV